MPKALPKKHLEPRRKINVFVLTMLSLAVVISLRNLPLSAEYGLSSVFYYCVAALVFMIPYALISAELASGWPKAGGVFIWVKEALGERWGFFAIWMQWFHNMTFYPAMLAFVGAGIAQLFAPELAANKFYLLGVVLVGFWGITLLNFLGVRTSSLVSTVCVIIGAILPGAILITLGIIWVTTGEPLSIHLTASALIPDFSSISHLVFLGGIFLALSGLEANANLAREVEHPQRSYPKAIFISASITLVILVLGSLSIAVVIPRAKISLVSGLLDAFRHFFAIAKVPWLTPIVSLLTVLGALGELNAWAIAGVKGLFVTTEYGCLPPVFHKINKNHIPTRLLLFQAIVVSLAAFVFLILPDVNISFWVLSALASQMYLLMYLLLFISGVVLRYQKPKVVRPYKIPLGNSGITGLAVLGVLAALFAIGASFIPPRLFAVVFNTYFYELIMIGGFLGCFLLPHIIYSLRKPHWKIEVLKEIQEEIHSSFH
ncbi:MAG: Glutamate/gamma-aminobutyrate antiporter [Chlamydiae bacterium]|nr:Glutamate/gamma-aminobutyrate antiporter [Chlamydiota bacterium]